MWEVCSFILLHHSYLNSDTSMLNATIINLFDELVMNQMDKLKMGLG